MRQRLEIGIAGCGIGGLAVGAFLARAGHRVTIFDRLAKPTPVGSGLILQPVGLSVLGELGALDQILALGQRIERLYGRVLPSQRVVLDVRYGALRHRGFGLAVHRAALFDVVYRAAISAGVICEYSSEVSGVEQASERAAFKLRNGKRSPAFDFAIDALGAYSVLSRQGRTLPFGALWANVPWPRQSVFSESALEQRYVRASTMVGVLPIGRLQAGRDSLAAFFWSLKGSDEPAWRAAPLEAWKDRVATVWPEAAALLSGLQRHEDLVFAQYVHRTQTPAVAGRLVHLGDSHHATSPQLGQGANMALLDAVSLAAALDHAPGLPEALSLYAASRRWHVGLYQLASFLFTPAYQSDSRWLPLVRDYIAGPISRIPPSPRLLAALVAGKLLWPRTSLEAEQPPEKTLLPALEAAAAEPPKASSPGA